MPTKLRLDKLLVRRGLAPSEERARTGILAGDVRVNGEPAWRAAAQFAVDVRIDVIERPRYVGRGGDKLAHAIATFDLDVRDCVALDVGASTGGFTDCLLQAGASRVYAVDTGYGQLDVRLREDARVVVMERTNARELDALPEPVAVATVDVSFIGLENVLPNVARMMLPSGRIVALVKPQFQARRDEVQPGGVVRDPLVHATVLGRVVAWASKRNLRLVGLTTSPLTGPAGNREFFLCWEVEG